MIPLHSQRVVLDLAFQGYGTSSELVARDGVLIGIAVPGKKYDPVPGAHVVDKALGTAVERLLDTGIRFDCIVADVAGCDTPAVGAFSPPLRLGMPRRLLDSLNAKETIPYEEAIWRAATLLRSDIGIAILNGVQVGTLGRPDIFTKGQYEAFREALG